MIGYMMHAVEAVEDSSTVSKTIHLNAGVRRVLGVLAVIPDAYADPGVAMTTRIGLDSAAGLLHRAAAAQWAFPHAGGPAADAVRARGGGRYLN